MNNQKNADITVKSRLAIYEKARVELTSSSSGKTLKYLESTGIYTSKGNLTKGYR